MCLFRLESARLQMERWRDRGHGGGPRRQPQFSWWWWRVSEPYLPAWQSWSQVYPWTTHEFMPESLRMGCRPGHQPATPNIHREKC